MKSIENELLDSEYVSIDEKGWHISDDTPENLKQKFKKFIQQAEEGIEIEIR